MICKKCGEYTESISLTGLCLDCEFTVEENPYHGDKNLYAKDTLTNDEILVFPQYSELFCNQWIEKNKDKYPELIFKIK